MTPQQAKLEFADQESQSEPKRFMSRRLGGNIDPTKISQFKYGCSEYDQDLHQAIMQNTRLIVDKNKMSLSVTQNLMQWSLFKKELIS